MSFSFFRKKLPSAEAEAPSSRRNRHSNTVAPQPVETGVRSTVGAVVRATGGVDVVLAAIVIALIGFGVVMVYSASAIEATVKFKDPQFFLKRQGAFAVAAVFALWLMSRLDYQRLKRFTYPVLLAVVLMLLATVIGFGHRAGNAYRWIAIGPIHIQPSEVAKLGIVLWLAYSLSKKGERVKSFNVGFVPHLLVVGLLGALCLKQPDFGSTVVLVFLTFTLLFVAGARVPYIIAATMLMALVGAALVYGSDYRYARYLAWVDMDSQRNDLAYQPFQSVMSFGSGGIAGLGLGRGLQVLYLPEAHTDFISAIIGEELGFIGILGLCAAYLVVVSRGVKVALEAHDDYGSFLAFGISTLFGVQAMVNLAVAMAILPTKGLTLPFLSYGGSSLLVNAAGVGILLNISRARSEVPLSASKTSGEDSPLPSAAAAVVSSAEEGATW